MSLTRLIVIYMISDLELALLQVLYFLWQEAVLKRNKAKKYSGGSVVHCLFLDVRDNPQRDRAAAWPKILKKTGPKILKSHGLRWIGFRASKEDELETMNFP